jgi:hypothetical protein
MSELRYSLIADGPSDDALLPVLNWLLGQHLPGIAIQPTFADLRHLPPSRQGLSGRIRAGVELYPCDLLFVHRDAEKEEPANRVREIDAAIEDLAERPPHACVVPVRMTEAWLLFDEPAIRLAAGNPNGRMPLVLPPRRETEGLVDPKETLRVLLREASGLTGRRLKNFQASPRRVANLIEDFSPLGGPPSVSTLGSSSRGACHSVAPHARTIR